MADQIQIVNNKVTLTTDDGAKIERTVDDFIEMFRREMLPPLNGTAHPDGTKFVEWREPFLMLVHQMPWQVRPLRWIANDSPVEFGEGTIYRKVRLSLPYAITFAVFYNSSGRLRLLDANELYFRNGPLTSKENRVCFPGLLNISRIPTDRREKAWICTQYLRRTPQMSWTDQLTMLLEHTWHGGFNKSSEHHEGDSWYRMYEKLGIGKEIHPVERWVEQTTASDAFGVSVKWKEAPHSVGELIDCIFEEQLTAVHRSSRRRTAAPSAGLVARFMNFAQKCARKGTKSKKLAGA